MELVALLILFFLLDTAWAVGYYAVQSTLKERNKEDGKTEVSKG